MCNITFDIISATFFFLLSPHINVKVSDEITKNCASDSYKHLIFIY